MTVRTLNDADDAASDTASATDGETRQSTREELGRFAEQGGFALTADTNPWLEAAETVTGPEDARAASTVLAELRSRDTRAVGRAAEAIAAKAGLTIPDTLGGLSTLLDLLQRVHATSATLRTEIYEQDLVELAAATGNAAYRKDSGAKLGWNRRRQLRAQARALAAAGTRPGRADLHAALVAAAAAHRDWNILSTAASRPAVPVDGTLLTETANVVESLTDAVRSLARLLPERALDSLPLTELADLVDRLAADEGTLYRLSALRQLRLELAEQGLTELLEELNERQADKDAALAAYDRHVAAKAALAAGPRQGEAAAEAVTEVEVEVEAEAAVEVEPEAEAAVEETAEEVGTETEAEVAAEAVEPVEEPAAEAEPEVEAVAAAEEPAAEVVVAAPAVEVEPEPETAVEEPVAEAEVEPEPEAVVAEEPVVEAEPEVVAAEEAVAEVEPEVVAEEAAVEPVAEPEAVAEVVAEEPVAEVVVEAPAVEVEPEPEAVVEEPVAEAVEPVEEPAAEAEPEAEPEPEAAVEEPVAVAEAVEPVVEPAAEAEPEAEPAPEVVAVEPVVEVEPEAGVVVEEPAPVAVAAGWVKPELVPGKPITGYSAEELVALVGWLDSDGEKRSDDELLRAAMKELGFARLGPRIKDALGAAVATVRA
ncbi:hypothetical protein HUT16_29130 [Kitasatospora sp. NA04385]|uniref:hypothetical protein n=1 Tax=Kitasatospora sp. NA04385 TaxID=2742135 RepID=UPI00159040A0|nr:hypothetical protein [Kitasatospora sp. NA04385]QKW22608.1 hypothetical protein HUT16_29130 [Kitasatospora sp. NA04385]